MNKQIRKHILTILENDVATRNSDKELMIQYFEQYVCNTSEEAYIFRELILRADTALANITRNRAHIQNKLGLYKSDAQIQEARNELEAKNTIEYSPINNGRRY